MPTIEATTFATNEVAELCGLTFRMVDYWSRTSRVLRPSINCDAGSGSRRRWTADDLGRIQKAACFSRALSPAVGGSTGSHGVSIETMERFVLEATETIGGWCWSTPAFTLTVRCD